MAGLANVFGSAAMSNSTAEIENTDALLVIGSNTTETHPIVALRMKKAVRKGAQLIVADPRRIPLTKFATLHLQMKPGTDVALINGICNVILSEGLIDKDFIAKRTEGFEEFVESIKMFTPEHAEKICDVPKEDIIRAARIYGSAGKAGIYYTMGITQHSMGTNNVYSIANLAMMCGNLGKKSCGVNPLRGQNNVQGSSDMACAPNVLPGYQKVTDKEAREKFELRWGTTLPDKIGLTATDMIDAMIDGNIKGMYVMGENPVLSDPNMDHTRKAFEALDFLIVQDIFMTETAELADVVLPAASFAEKDGTFTNTERRVQRVRKSISPPGQARDDLSIIEGLSIKMGGYDHLFEELKIHGYTVPQQGKQNTFLLTPEQAFSEICSLWPHMSGMTYQRLSKHGLQWPCPSSDHPGTKFLFKDGFPRGKGRFTPLEYQPSQELPDKEYPFILTTGRVLFQYHTGTMSRRSTGLEAAAPEPFVEISEEDARQLGVIDGEILAISSRRGNIEVKARVGNRVKSGLVFIPFHYHEAAANTLTNNALDPVCKIAETKVCAVRLEKLS